MKNKKKLIMTKKGKCVLLGAMLWLVINFIIMVGIALPNGTSPFPDGSRDSKGYYSYDHGKRYDFSPVVFHFGYWQALLTWVSFPIVIIYIVPTLYIKGDIREEESL